MRILTLPITPALSGLTVKQLLRHLARLRQRLAHAQARVDRLFWMLLDQLHRAHAATRKRLPIHQYLTGLRALKPGEHAAQRGFAEP